MKRMRPQRSLSSRRHYFLWLVQVPYTALVIVGWCNPRSYHTPWHYVAWLYTFCWASFLYCTIRAWRDHHLECRARGKRGPVFVWQAALILLPVALLAGVGFYYLEQDRRLAEDEARERAQVMARELAENFDQVGHKDFFEYLAARGEYASQQASRIGLVKTDRNFETDARQRIHAWNAEHPDLGLAELPLDRCELTRAKPGESAVRTDPYWHSFPPAPEPPGWWDDLTLSQRELWRAVERAEAQPGGTPLAQAAITNFLAAHPCTDAAINARYHALRLQARGLPVSEAVKLYVAAPWGWGGQFTETGIPISQILCEEALRLLPDHAGLPYPAGVSLQTPDKIAWAIAYAPSAFSPQLIREVSRVAQTNDPFAGALNEWWDANERTGRLAEEFRAHHPVETLSNGFYWHTDSERGSGRYLFVLSQPWVGTNEYFHFQAQIIPEPVVARVLTDTLATNELTGMAVPAYLRARVILGNGEILAANDSLASAVAARALPVLGEAQGSLVHLWFPDKQGYPFRVQILLADRAGLYAHQRQRLWLLGGLILVSALASVWGCVALWRAFRRQQELNALKSNFVSSVSHELRAPIASVRLMAENLEHGKVTGPEKEREYYRFIGQECRRLSALIENVLDFARIEQGRKQYEFELVNLDALMGQTVTLLEPYAAEKGVRLERAPGVPAAPGELVADGRALQQALVNLLDNAIKHSPRSGAVRTGFAVTPAGAQLWVEDDGPGIPAAEQARIFERFYRRGSELRRETQGVGIGLSIVKHIVEAHGGRVTVASVPGCGSRFTLELPAYPPGGAGADKTSPTL